MKRVCGEFKADGSVEAEEYFMNRMKLYEACLSTWARGNECI